MAVTPVLSQISCASSNRLERDHLCLNQQTLTWRITPVTNLIDAVVNDSDESSFNFAGKPSEFETFECKNVYKNEK